MLESERLLLNIKAAHKDIIAVGKRNDLSQEDRQKALYNFQRQIKGYETELFIALAKEKHTQAADG